MLFNVKEKKNFNVSGTPKCLKPIKPKVQGRKADWTHMGTFKKKA